MSTKNLIANKANVVAALTDLQTSFGGQGTTVSIIGELSRSVRARNDMTAVDFIFASFVVLYENILDYSVLCPEKLRIQCVRHRHALRYVI